MKLLFNKCAAFSVRWRWLVILFIPIIIAMAATQNVRAALSGGWIPLVVGGVATMACFFLVPLVAKIGKQPVATKIKVS